MRALITTLIFMISLSAQATLAKVVQTPDKTYSTQSDPVDVAASVDGRYTFVLERDGTVNIYSKEARTETINVGPGYESISVSATGDKIWLSSRQNKKVQSIFIDFVRNFKVDNSPFLGEENAPVVIVAFSDFQ